MDKFERHLVCKTEMNCEGKRSVKNIYRVFYWSRSMDVGALGILEEEQQVLGKNTVRSNQEEMIVYGRLTSEESLRLQL